MSVSMMDKKEETVPKAQATRKESSRSMTHIWAGCFGSRSSSMILEQQYNTVPAMTIKTAYTVYTIAESSILKPTRCHHTRENFSCTVCTLVDCALKMARIDTVSCL